MKKYIGLKYILIRLKVLLMKDAAKRAEYLGKREIFAGVGEGCYLKLENYLLKLIWLKCIIMCMFWQM